MAKKMINEVFEYMGNNVRIIGTKKNPLFCLKDVCDILELRINKVIQRLNSEENEDSKGVLSKYPLVKHTIPTPGGPQQMYFVTESGLYDVIFDSRKKIAKKFRKWVTNEVLPSIRMDGLYEDEYFEFLRQMGIEDRNMLTSSIKAFKKYCKEVFHIKPKRYCIDGCNLYSTITILINGVLNLPNENDRDELTKKELEMLSRCEDKVSQVLLLDITKKKHPDLIFIHLKEALFKRRKKFIEKGLIDDKELVDIFTFEGYYELLDDMKERSVKKNKKG